MKNYPEEIHNVAQSIFSIARYSGGCTIQGQGYTYDPIKDILIRDDVLAKREKEKKVGKREQRIEQERRQLKLEGV